MSTRASRFDVVVVGSAYWDFVVRGERLPGPGDDCQGEVFYEGPGGKGCNQAVAAARLGARVAFVGRVGDDARGERIVDRLWRERVDVSKVKRDPKADTGVAVMMVDAQGQSQSFSFAGANGRANDQDVRDVRVMINEAKVLMTQLELPLDAVLAALTIGREEGVKTLLDPGPGAGLPVDALALVDVLKPTAAEALTLTGIDATSRSGAQAAGAKLLTMGPGLVAIEVGDEGYLVMRKDGGGESWFPRLHLPMVDRTGAGDAFAAAMAVLLAEGRRFDEAGAFAQAAATLQTAGLGGQQPLPTREDVAQMLARNVHGKGGFDAPFP